jgi:nanoRNase/pAp phosphatase (c-di-AMP/oligoRNAs hydrolase)
MKQKVLHTLEQEDAFLILLHSNADPDAAGSAVALKEFLRLHNKTAHICCHSANRMAKQLLSNLDETINCDCADTFKTVIVLDTSSPSQLGSCIHYLEHAETVVVIDHHRNSSFTDYIFLHEERTSTAEILFDLLPERNKKINIALLSGILTDTGNFKYATADTMKTVYKILEDGVKLYEVFDMFTETRNVPQRIAIVKGCKRLKLHKIGKYLVVTTRVNSHESTTAGFLIQVVDIAFVANASAGRIIAKAAPHVDIDLSLVMKTIGELYNGDGGGHKRAAGATGESMCEALDHCVELVQEKLAI